MEHSRAWAKLAPNGDWLPLADHGADVAAVLACLLEEPSWRGPLEVAARRALGAPEIARLCVLAFLHDLGKANAGFWKRQFPGAPIIGHTDICASLFSLEGPQARQIESFMVDWGADRLFVATLAHHGLPLSTFAMPPGGIGRDHEVANRILREQQYWREISGYDPLAELQGLLDTARARFPLAFAPAAPPLPGEPRFVALVAGLMTLADWLGSDERHFSIGSPHGEAREAMRTAAAERVVAGRGLGVHPGSPASFEAAFGFAPRGPQLAPDLGSDRPIVLIEAETGSGKTEAALWHWLKLREAGHVDGLYFALPTRSAAVQLHQRVRLVLDRTFGARAIEPVLAVPGYIRAGDAEGQRLPGFEVLWPDDEEGHRDARWAAEAPRQFLTARVAVGTVDQVLMSGLKVRHAHQRAAALSRNLLVVDEVHASDVFMATVLEGVIANHTAIGGRAALLSATLGGEARARLLGDPAPSMAEAICTAYPALTVAGKSAQQVPESGTGKPVTWFTIPQIDDAGAIAARAVDAAQRGAKVLVIRNSVAGAVSVGRAVEQRAPELCFAVNGVHTLHHGRFAPGDRRLLDREVEARFGRTRSTGGCILVGTQTLEQSLDIDADLLITDLAPIDVLLQRIGRLHRHGRPDRGSFSGARAEILVPAQRDLGRYLGRVRDRHGLGPLADGSGVYPELITLEATWRLIEENRKIEVPLDNRRLVEGALHSEVLDRLEIELGTAWANHAAQQSGVRYADGQLALKWRLDMSVDFQELLFPSDEHVRTRLGANDRLVDLSAAPMGPFGQPVERLTIPGWMAAGIPAEAEPVVSLNEAGFVFSFGEKSYAYSRFGLERLEGE